LSKSKSYRLLGVDPGTNVLGYALIDIQNNKVILVAMGVIKMSKLGEQQHKLKKIFIRLQEIILQYRPAEMAIEAPFFGKNVQSMLKLGRAQGVAIAAAITNNVQVIEYSPKKIKQSVTGNGNASKEQVAAMLATIIGQKLDKQTLDATDALGAAVCHFFQSGSPMTGKKKYSDWSAFAKDNVGRISRDDSRKDDSCKDDS